MDSILVCTVAQWLPVYNDAVVRFVAQLLQRSFSHAPHRCISLVTPSGQFIRSVTISQTTTLNAILTECEQLSGEWDYETTLDRTSLVWGHVEDGGQLMVTHHSFKGILHHKLRNLSEDVEVIQWHPHGTKILCGGHDNTIRMWDFTTQHMTVLEGHESSIRTLCWNPSGTKIASGSFDQTLRLWENLEGTGIKSTILAHCGEWVISTGWHPSGAYIAGGCFDSTMYIWDIQTRLCIQELKGHTSAIRGIQWHPSGNLLASGSNDSTVRIWSRSEGQETYKSLIVLKNHLTGVWSICWSPSGAALASASYDHTVRIWNTRTWQCTAICPHFYVHSICWNPQRKLFASGSKDGMIRVWETASWRCLHVIQSSNAESELVWHPDGTQLACRGDAKTIFIWR